MAIHKKMIIIATIVCIGLYFLGLGLHVAYGADREWFAFMMDKKTCIEVNAENFEDAVCVLERLAEEDKYKLAEVIDACPGMLADDYYYDFSFKECIK